MRKFLLICAVAAAVLSCGKTQDPVSPVINNKGQSNIPNKTGMNIKGRVVEAGKNTPLKGIVVSDGQQCTVTDEDGCYWMASDLSSAKFVFPVLPADYEIQFGSTTTWCGYSKIDASKSVGEYSFTLAPRTGSADAYTMLFLGDPQVMSSRPHSITSWEYVTKGLKQYASTVSGPLYQTILGDMVVNEIEVSGKADRYLSQLATAGVRSFHIPGNHDHVQDAVTYSESIEKYDQYFGPHTFAINIGKLHYIFFDTCIWENKTFTEGITDEAWQFIQSDLQYVPAGTPIMLCTHCPITKRHGGNIPGQPQHMGDLVQLLNGREAIFWYGHLHFNVFWNYTAAELAANAPGLKNLDSHVVGRCGGCWACSGEVGRDGSPRGFVEMTVNGSDYKWRYRSIDPNYPDDFNVLLPGAFKGEGIADDSALYCNVYIWDDLWGTPELWVDGKKAGDFQHCFSAEYPACADPLYAHFYPIWLAQNISGFRKEPPVEYDNNHLFKIVPPAGCKSCEIRVKDRWGQEIKRNVTL